MSIFSIFKRARTQDNGQTDLSSADLEPEAEKHGSYHNRFVVECRSGIDQIRQENRQILSRRLRNSCEGLCEVLGRIVDKLQSDPSLLSDTRALPGAIRLTAEILQEYQKIFAVDSVAEREKRRIALESIDALRTDLQQTHDAMTQRAEVNLSALTRTLERLRLRDIGGKEVIPVFQQQGEES